MITRRWWRRRSMGHCLVQSGTFDPVDAGCRSLQWKQQRSKSANNSAIELEDCDPVLATIPAPQHSADL